VSRRGGSLKTSMQKIARELSRQGWDVSLSGGTHWRFCPRDKSKPMLFMPQSPSDHRGFLNGIALLKAAGADVRSFKS
jgi:predicted alpha/beta-fold hydrolase